jgi:hypothetical protein
MFAGQMVTVAYISQQQFEAVRAATHTPAAAAAAEDASAAVAAVGLVTHGSPSPERTEGAGKVGFCCVWWEGGGQSCSSVCWGVGGGAVPCAPQASWQGLWSGRGWGTRKIMGGGVCSNMASLGWLL